MSDPISNSLPKKTNQNFSLATQTLLLLLLTIVSAHDGAFDMLACGVFGRPGLEPAFLRLHATDGVHVHRYNNQHQQRDGEADSYHSAHQPAAAGYTLVVQNVEPGHGRNHLVTSAREGDECRQDTADTTW